MTHTSVNSLLNLIGCVILFNIFQLLKQVSAQNVTSFHNLTECTRFHTKNITGGKLHDGSYHYRNEVYPPGHFGNFDHFLHENGSEIATETHVRGCICTHSKQKCIRVCCDYIKKEGEWILPEICPYEFEKRIFHNTTEKEIFVKEHHFLVYDDTKCEEKVDIEHDVYENGSIFVPHDNSFLDYDKHCISVENQTLLVLICAGPGEHEQRFRILGIGMLLSVPFLLITFIVYAVIPELRNVHGMSLMSYVGSLMIAYTFLGIVQINSYYFDFTEDQTFCTSAAYIIYFSFMLSFFWLNSMCFDIFWTFRRLRINSSPLKNFLYYCIYAWGMASFLTLLALCLDLSNINEDYKPGMYYKHKCFLKDNKLVEFLYLYMILLILVCTNITFFVLTTIQIRKVQSETTAVVGTRQTNDSYDKFRFVLYFRLFIIMGATWFMEILSWFISSSSPWFYATDLVNCLQGILIFLLVVCNDKVRKLIVKKYYQKQKSLYIGTKPTGLSTTGQNNNSFEMEVQQVSQSK